MEKPLRLLIIEDYEPDAHLLLRRIKQYGFSPHYRIISQSPELANALDEEEWDIVISDYILPGFSGLEALKLIQARHPEIPVIMVSGKIRPEVALEAIRTGAKDYIAKDDLGRLGFAIEREILELKDRRQTKISLRDTQEFSSNLLENAPNPVIVTNPDTSIKYVNPAFEKLTGFTAAEVIGVKAAYPYWSVKSPPGEPSNFEKVIWSKKSYREQRVFRKKSGDLFQVETAGVPVLDPEGNLKYFISNWVDISESQKMLEDLHKSEAFNASLLNDSPNPILVINLDNSIKYMNPALEKLTGYSKEEILGRPFPPPWWPEDKVKDYDLQNMSAVMRQALIEERGFKKKNGELFWVTLSLRQIEEHGEPIYYIANWVDITDKKKAEEQIKYQAILVDNVSDAIVSTDLNHCILSWNRAAERIYGWKRGEVLGKKIVEIIPLVSRSVSLVESLDDRLNKTGYWEGETIHERRDGSYLNISSSVSRVLDSNGKAVGHVAVFRDATKVKQAEERLRQSERKYWTLVEKGNDGIILIQGYLLKFVNSNLIDKTGYSREEVLDKPFINFVAQEYRAEVADKYKRRMSGEITIDGYEIEIVSKDGKIIPMEIRASTIDYEGKPADMAIMRDITERKRAEAALKHSQGQLRKFSFHLQEQLELEKKYLAAEIHDELGQMLTALKIDLSWLAKRIPGDLAPQSDKIQAMMSMINETDKIVKRISSNLRPPVLDDLGLIETLKWFTSQFQERTGIQCFLKVPVSEIWSKKQAIDLFRIVQEALTNIARHSEATNVRIAMQNEADNLVITIRDNGKGISKSQIENDKSFGIMGMQERAHILGGVLTITESSGKGTTVKLVVPARK